MSSFFFCYNIRMKSRAWLVWYVVERKKFLGREFKVGKPVFTCWLSDS